MKKIVAVSTLAITLGLGALTTGCSSTWWQQFQQNPVQQVQSFESTIQVGINAAQVAWTFVQPYLPAATAAQINTAFQDAVATVNHTLSVLNDAVSAAVAAQQPTPDFSALMQAVSDAFNQVLAIIAQYETKVPAPTTLTPGQSRLPGFDDAKDAGAHALSYIHHPATAHAH